MSYDPDKTQQVIHRHTGGDSLNPMNMLYDGQAECFNLIGKNKDKISKIETTDADQGARITAVEARQNKLENRLWGLLAAFLTAVISGGVGLWFAG